MNESFISVFDSLNQSATREEEFQSLQLKLKENEDLIKPLEMLQGTQAVEISQLKERISKLEEELKGRDERIGALTTKRVDLIRQVAT